MGLGALCLAFGEVGCARTYVPAKPRVQSTQAAAVAVESLRLAPLFYGIGVELSIAAPKDTWLHSARLALDADKPCDAGLALSEVEFDGVPIAQGPLNIGGQHELHLAFGGQPEAAETINEITRKSAEQPAYVDLSFAAPDGERSCSRVALIGGKVSPQWQMSKGSAGAFVAVYGRAYPAGFGSDSQVQPSGGLGERLGAAWGSSRLWADIGAALPKHESSANIVMTLGGDQVFWHTDDVAFRAGAGYDLVLNMYRPDQSQASHLRYTLHGPRAALGMSYALIHNLVLPNFSTHPALPTDNRTFSLEIEVPVSIWFGRSPAPRTTVVPGLGLGLFWSF